MWGRCSVDGYGVARLCVLDRCAEDSKVVVALSAKRVSDKVKDHAAVAQCGQQQDGIRRDIIFVKMIGG